MAGDFIVTAVSGEGRRPPQGRRGAPAAAELRATVNPRTNLAHCFGCGKNLNNIDLLLTLGYDFRSAVSLLERWLTGYESRRSKEQKPPTEPH